MACFLAFVIVLLKTLLLEKELTYIGQLRLGAQSLWAADSFATGILGPLLEVTNDVKRTSEVSTDFNFILTSSYQLILMCICFFQMHSYVHGLILATQQVSALDDIEPRS